MNSSEMKQCADDCKHHRNGGEDSSPKSVDIDASNTLKTTKKNTAHLNATDFLIASKRSEIKSLEYFLEMGQLIVMVSDLIHALQKERGASNLYIGSKGQHFAEQLVEYTATSNLRVTEFHAVLKSINPHVTVHTGNSRLLNRIAYTLQALASLPQFRAQVRQLNSHSDDVITIYSETISGLLSIIFETADAAVDPTIARILVALFNLMHGKELSGRERAVGVAGFSAREFSAEQRGRLQFLIEGQERCFELFREFADPASGLLWEQYTHSFNVSEIERLRRVALSERPQMIEPQLYEQWFKLLTQHIDNLKTVELGLQMHLQQLCLQRVSDAKKMLTQQQDLIDTLSTHAEDTFVVLLSHSQMPNIGASSPHDYYQTEGIGPKLGRSVFELVQNQAHSLQQMNDELTAARTAIEEKKLQEKAKVLLMKNRKLTEDQAHKLLRQMAMDQGKRLSEIARTIVDMAHIWR